MQQQPSARAPSEELTVQCALEGACVLLERDTPLSEALSLLDEAAQSVALIVSLPWRMFKQCGLIFA